MKKHLFFTLLVLFGLPLLTHAQSVIQEGQWTFSAVTIEADDPQATQALQGATITLRALDDVVRSQSSLMGNRLLLEQFYRQSTGEGFIFLNLGGQKFQVTVPDSIHQARRQERVDNSIITYYDDDTKVIEGLTCRRALVETLRDDGSIREVSLYLTDEMAFPAEFISGLPANLRGFPLEFTVSTPGQAVTFRLEAFEPQVNETIFALPDDHQEMPYATFAERIGKQLGF